MPKNIPVGIASDKCDEVLDNTVRLSTLTHDDVFTYSDKEYKFDVITDGIAKVIQVERAKIQISTGALKEVFYGIAREELSPDVKVTLTGKDTG